MSAAIAQEVLKLNQLLLDSIMAGDWAAYEKLCCSTITCFEPEARGQVVEGMAFHKFYFPPAPVKSTKVVTMSQPHVRVMGDNAVVLSYVRLTQSCDASGVATTGRMEETRVWQKIDGQWKHVHFHRAPGAV
ncbi:MAG: DUF4440 domain-containing protein [Pirellulales bacterium]